MKNGVKVLAASCLLPDTKACLHWKGGQTTVQSNVVTISGSKAMDSHKIEWDIFVCLGFLVGLLFLFCWFSISITIFCLFPTSGSVV